MKLTEVQAGLVQRDADFKPRRESVGAFCYLGVYESLKQFLFL